MSGETDRITRASSGDWRHGQGLAPCPICQPEARRNQPALSISERGGRMLLHCHKSGCAVFHELRAKGLVGLANTPDRKEAEAQIRSFSTGSVIW